jgi:hypothetical protein
LEKVLLQLIARYETKEPKWNRYSL